MAVMHVCTKKPLSYRSYSSDTVWSWFCGVQLDGKPSRGILEAVDFRLLSDFEISQWASQLSRKTYHYHYHYHYHSQRALMAPPQGVPIEYVFLEHVINRTDGVLQHGFMHPFPRFSVTPALVLLDSEAGTMTSLGSKTSERLSLYHLSCRLRVFAQDLARLALTPRDAFDGPLLTSVPSHCSR